MSLVGSGLKHTSAIGGCVTEGLVLLDWTRAFGEEQQQLPGSNVASTYGGKFKFDVRCQKRNFLARIEQLGRVLSLCTGRQEVSLCWDKLENLGKDVSKFHQLLIDNGCTVVPADVGDKVRL